MTDTPSRCEPPEDRVPSMIRRRALHRMTLPHHLAGMSQADVCETARWAQTEIARLKAPALPAAAAEIEKLRERVRVLEQERAAYDAPAWQANDRLNEKMHILSDAINIIAGRRQCIDPLMSNQEVAIAARELTLAVETKEVDRHSSVKIERLRGALDVVSAPFLVETMIPTHEKLELVQGELLRRAKVARAAVARERTA